ncbi:UDP-N-acetylmuramoyl-L-alanyl-D-glutamate--2,6-diaminopimelate ligase [soil metagenome]
MKRWFVDRSAGLGIPSISLRRLLPEARFLGCEDLEVAGCSADSRRIDPGQVFVALRGDCHDGHDFIARALERGAAGVVVERPCPEAGRPQVLVPDARRALARIGFALAGDPCTGMEVFGIAGSAGKTATAHLLRSIFEAAGVRVGLIGPDGWSDGVDTFHAGPSTPHAVALAEMLASMVDQRCQAAVVEIPDESLQDCQVEGMRFASAAVTQIPLDGREEAEATRSRRARFARLCRRVKPDGAVVFNADDPDSALLGAVNLEAEAWRFGLDPTADLSAVIEPMDAEGSRFLLKGLGREAVVELRLIGAEAVRHALAAAALARAGGIDPEAIVEGLQAVDVVPGRLERVAAGQPFDVRIDRARTAPELRRAFSALRDSGAGRVLCVLGAEGDGDRARRLALGQAAETGADLVILTTDSPRAEDPDQILDDLSSDFSKPGRVRILSDRRQAIETALGLAGPGDAVLIAGRGRQKYQIFANTAHPFDDADTARQWLLASPLAHRKRSA